MLNKIKKAVSRLLGIDDAPAQPKKAAAANAPRKKAAAAQPAERRRTEDVKPKSRSPQTGGRTRATEKTDPEAGGERRGGRDRRNAAPKSEAPRPAAAPAPAAVRPEQLADVPVAEGKIRFLDLPIHPDVQFGIQRLGFQYCTPIQALTLPPLFENRDIAGKAQTGTGKTAAFLISTFTRLLNHPLAGDRKPGSVRALVMAPTRELAIQIHKDAEALGVFTGLRSVVVFGGMDHEKQRRSLNAPVDLLIGTPGRIIDYSRGGSLDFSKTEVLVIDEADRMLDMGFIPDVKRIVAQLPKKADRQTMLFSATLDDSILRLSAGWLVEPVIIDSEPENLVSTNIEQTFYSVLREDKLALLLHVITHDEFDRMLIFGNRKDVNLRLQEDLERYGISVPILSGDIPQDRRIKILERFRSGEEKIVIATDVAARGIHVDDVSIVVNYDLPERAEDYVHRIGRTGRAGRLGKSISFLCEYGAYNLPEIEKLLDQTFSSTQPEEEMLKLPPPVPGARPARRASSSSRRDSGPRRGGPRRSSPRR